MFSLITCSVSSFDEYDDYVGGPTTTTFRRRRSMSRSLGFVKTAVSSGGSSKKRKTGKMSIGSPTDFRHEFHLGRDVGANDAIALWDARRWQQELEKESRTSLPSSIAPSTVAPSTPAPSNISKRNSITPQKRKPVPSVIIDSPMHAYSPHEIPLPPSPITRRSEEQSPMNMAQFFDPPSRGPSVDEGDMPDVAETVEDDAPHEIEQTRC